jgi:hypothetical protein
MRSRIEPMKKIARSLRVHRELILKLLPRPETAFQWRCRGIEQQGQSHHEKAYGFRMFRVLELALYHSLAKLSEPETTHDFF